MVDNAGKLELRTIQLYTFIGHYTPFKPDDLDRLDYQKFFLLLQQAEKMHKAKEKAKK